MTTALQQLKNSLEGELYFDQLMRTLYATDASVYRELPLAVARPKNKEDVKKIIAFAKTQRTSIIPRTAGTSLAGQCVGNGIVVDVSKYLTNVIELNKEEGWVRLQPGVVRDQLNEFLCPHGLFFGPNTSTANRCMIGGMVGNNSCGSTSIAYGSTRDHVLELEVILSDGSEVVFKSLSEEEFAEKQKGDALENRLYRHVSETLSQPKRQREIREHFPKPSIHRRNTGYAVDLLLETKPFTPGKPDFNFCKLLCGSEGTLAFTTAIKLNVVPLPAPEEVVVCAHFSSIKECMRAVLVAMAHQPTACELMDKIILDCTKNNIGQQKNRFFVEGDPAAILMVEFRGQTKAEAEKQALAMVAKMKKANLGFAFPIIFAPKTKSVWDLRKAGLGLLGNIPGDPKAVAFVEDTAVELPDLPDYIAEFDAILEGFGQQAVHYAHAGAGELHVRPILNLKKTSDRQLFYDIGEASAKLVRKYKGSLSGEHGDGRVRAEFIPLMIGQKNYQFLKELKQTWDPQHIFNPGKIVDAPPMNSSLRYEAEQETLAFDTVFDFSATQGILRTAEKCNGAGDCRKLDFSGGTMCPSYRATRDEKHTTRARANALREFLSRNGKENPFDHPELREVMDLCLSCKGCTSECPSNVDMTMLKSEFLHQYYQSNPIPLRAKVFANFGKLNSFASFVPGISNFIFSSGLTAGVLKKLLQIAPQRTLPLLHKTTLRKWFEKSQSQLKIEGARKGSLFFFCDEFTNFNDVEIGIKAIRLLTKLGYEVQMPKHAESGRAQLSKGLLKVAQRMAMENVEVFKNKVTQATPLIGLEPSAILGFRDEYPKLVAEEAREEAVELGKNALLLDEFFAREIQKGNITSESFTKAKQSVKLHGHCHQKALSTVEDTAWMLNLPENFSVEVIPSGCCGMAGSFGYEKEHFELSMKIGELVLFPAVRQASPATLIAAPGTSCRHQILDGTGRKALHPVEILWDALKEK